MTRKNAQVRLKVCTGASVQVALQSALLHYALPARKHGVNNSRGTSSGYANHCDPEASASRGGASVCFAKTLAVARPGD